jgi:hypothetical protein
MRKYLMAISLILIPFLYFNCAQSGGGSDSSATAQTSDVSKTVRETLVCNRVDIGVQYTMITYSDNSKKIDCTRIGSVPITTVSTMTCQQQYPLQIDYTYPVSTYRIISGTRVPIETHEQAAQVFLSYNDPSCSLMRMQ